MILIAATVALELAVCLVWTRRGTPIARLTPAAAPVREPEPFWFPTPPACSYDQGREVLVHVAPAYADERGEVLEFPIAKGWDIGSIATTLAQIEAL